MLVTKLRVSCIADKCFTNELHAQLKNMDFKEPFSQLFRFIWLWINILQKLEAGVWELGPQGPEDEQDMRDGH